MSTAPSIFSRVGVAVLLGVGLASFAGFVLLLAFSGGPGDKDGGGHALSRSAVGFAGVVALLRANGTPVVVSRAALDTAAGQSGPGLFVLTPPPGHTGPAQVPEANGEVLIVLPKWRTGADPDHAGWVEPRGLLPAADVLGALPAPLRALRLVRHRAREHPALRASGLLNKAPDAAHVESLQTFRSADFTPLLQDAAGGIVLGRHEDGAYVLADPDLLDNLAMAGRASAEDAVALLTLLSDGDPVVFDVSLDGLGRTRNLLRLVFERPLLGATLCALATAGLIGLLCTGRFGPVRPPERAVGAGARALVDNAAGLIARAGRERRMALPYAELTRSVAARLTAAPRALTPAQQDAYLDQAGSIRAAPERFSSLMAEAGTVRDRAGMLRLAERLHRWRRGLIHGYR